MKYHPLLLLAACILLAIFGAHSSATAIDLVSTSSTGVQGSENSTDPSVGGDGRFVVFTTRSALLPEDTNGVDDIYLKNTVTGDLSIVSLNTANEVGNAGSFTPVISDSGTHVAFASSASDLVDNDTNQERDVFVRDLAESETTRVSVTSSGVQSNGYSERPVISSDGAVVAFISFAPNLVPVGASSDSNVYARLVGDASSLELLSRNLSGNPGDGSCRYVAISADGDWVAFLSNSTDLVEGDVEGRQDIFLCKRGGGEVQRISEDSSGIGFGDDSDFPSLSGKGDFISFYNGDEVYLHSVENGSSRVVFVNSNGEPSNDFSRVGLRAITSDGGSIVFRSSGTNLGGTGAFGNVYRHEPATGETLCLSNTPDRAGPDSFMYSPTISADGSTVVFTSNSQNLVANDSNGSKTDIFIVKMSDFLPIDNSAARAALQKKIRVLKKKAALAKRKKQAGKAKRLKKSIRRLTVQLQRW